MHVGRVRAGWSGLFVAGFAFIAPAVLIVGGLAALYVGAGELPVTRGVIAAIQPVVVVMVLQAVVPLGREALRSLRLFLIAAAALVAALAGLPEIYVLVLAGAAGMMRSQGSLAGVVMMFLPAALAAAGTAGATAADVTLYFLRVGSLLFGSGYVLLPVLHGDLVERFGWLTGRQVLDAIAAGQATPGPLFSTATFIGYLLGGPLMALAATAAMFAPAFLFAAVSSAMLDRLRASARARAFLDGVNAAAVALIGLVVVSLGRVAFDGALPVAIGLAAAAAILAAGISPTRVLLLAAAAGACFTWLAETG
jgi:chromate transporter